MYKVPNPHGHEAGEVFTKTDMYKVKPVNE